MWVFGSWRRPRRAWSQTVRPGCWIGKETEYRWLRETFVALREQGSGMTNTEVEDGQRAGDWEGDLILGVGCASAMMTLRERKTQYGIVVNLPADQTAAKVNAAAIKAFARLPKHMKRTLTWDQGTEMARRQDPATETAVDSYFAERSSPGVIATGCSRRNWPTMEPSRRGRCCTMRSVGFPVIRRGECPVTADEVLVHEGLEQVDGQRDDDRGLAAVADLEQCL